MERLLDRLITTEFSFIQELIWPPPHKNPFPLCSRSIISRLKELRGEWLRASATARQLATSLNQYSDADINCHIAMSLENLEADIKVLVVLRKRCLKLLQYNDSTIDASTNTVNLAKKVDSILLQHFEDSWKELRFNSTGTDIHEQKRIDQDCLTAEVLQVFVLDSSQQCQRLNKDGIAEANSNVPGADGEANIASPLQGQSLPSNGEPRGEHSLEISNQEPGLHILTTEAIKDAARQSATKATKSTLQEILQASNADENSFKSSCIGEELCVFTPKQDTIRSSKCDTPKAALSASIQAHSALTSIKRKDLSIFTPKAVNDADRGTIGTSECLLQSDQEPTATSEAKPNHFISKTEDMEDDLEQVVAQLQESPSCFSSDDEYFSAGSDNEHSSMKQTGGIKNSGDNQEPKSAIIVNGAASLRGENDSEVSEVKLLPPGEGPVSPKEIQIFSSNRNIDEAPKYDEHALRESPFSETARVKEDTGSSAGNCSKELVEVEMILRAKICEAESDEPYWHVMFALLNHSNFKVNVQKLEYWSIDSRENVKCVHWGPGEMILREQPSFLCHTIKLACFASSTSPRLAFTWQYSKFPEGIPTKVGKPKIEMQKGNIRKQFENMRSLENAKKKFKYDTGRRSLKSIKKRTA